MTSPQHQSLSTDELVIFRRYAGISLPRHVAYPMTNWWKDLSAAEAEAMRARSNHGRSPTQSHENDSPAPASPPPDLSFYVHIPFCESLCKFCGCNKIILKKERADAPQRVSRFFSALLREISMLAEQIDSSRLIRQLHLGGGSPTYLSVDQLQDLHRAIAADFTIAPDAEQAVEVDPRITTAEQLAALRNLGFNRISLGVQDFDAQVQQHVRRIQPLDMVRRTTDEARRVGFHSVNFDIIFGLPYQTVESVARTIEQVIELGPDRIAYYHYAQVPDKIATQRGIDHTKLPDSDAKLEMFLMGKERFTAAGYEFIGLDHFALPDEALAESLQQGTITRNFQGMTTGRQLDLFGVGPSAISHLRQIGFIQNATNFDRYTELIDSGVAAVNRGMALSRDDFIRQTLLEELYGTAAIVPARIEQLFGIDFESYFSSELKRLAQLESDRLIERLHDGRIVLTDPLGRILMRNVAAVFDAYLEPEAFRVGATHEYSTNA